MGKRIWILLLGCLISSQGFGQVVTVWPGDANNNGTANHFDLLYIATNYGLTGPARNTISTVWAPQSLPVLWNTGGPALPDAGYADCDGSGSIGQEDVAALVQNFGEVWHAGPYLDSSSLVVSGAPVLSVGFGIDTISVQGTVSFTMSINLGSGFLPVDSIQGIAFTIGYDTTLIDSVGGFLPGPFFAADSNFTYVFRDVPSLGLIEIAISRTNHTNISGMGQVGTIVVALDDNIRTSADFQVPLEIKTGLGLTAAGIQVSMVAQGDTMQVLTNLHTDSDSPLRLYPNPSDETFRVSVSSQTAGTLRVMNMHGALVAETMIHPSINPVVNTAQWPAGFYFVEVQSQEGTYRGKLQVLHQSR